MAGKDAFQDNGLERIEAMLRDLLAAAAEIDGRFDLFNQEFQRVATLVRRSGLARENEKSGSRERTRALESMAQRLERIEALLERR